LIHNILNILGVFHVKVEIQELGLRQPIGLSFIVFSMISYLVDSYREEKVERYHFSDLVLYGAFFPKIMSGPIVRWKDFCGACSQGACLSDVYCGMMRFCIGFSKKILLANQVAKVSDTIFAMEGNVHPLYAWIGIIAYSLYIFVDFSSYSDMAIGLGKVFGFTFLENFDYPYISTSIKEFWRRWHISLSSWFRDYVYIPLGGNRKGMKKTYLNLLTVFLLTGIWHGASWNYIIWGLYYGFFLILERVTSFTEKIPKFWAHVYALLVIMVGWVFFRTDNISNALQYIENMFTCISVENYAHRIEMIRLLNVQNVAVFIVSVAIATPACKKVWDKMPSSMFKNIGVCVMFFVSICYMVANSYNPFIYFTF